VEAARDEFGLQTLSVVAACPEQYMALHPGSLPGRLRVLSPARTAAAVARALKGETAGPTASGLTPEQPGGPTQAQRAGPRQPERRADRLPAFPRLPAPGEDARVLRITGLRHVLRALEKAEASALAGVELLALYACDQGCWGSPLFTEDPYLARHRAAAVTVGRAPALPRTRPYQARPGLRLDEDMPAAIRKLALIDELSSRLPGRDCGICGAPNCASRAEDIVLGRVVGRDCPLELKEEK
jgi:hypothetical protein